jgi:hypothetical protein
VKCLIVLTNILTNTLLHSATPSSVRHNSLLITHNSIRLLLAQFLRASPVTGIDRCVEEIAHVVDNGTCLTEFSERAGSFSAECGGEGAGFD